MEITSSVESEMLTPKALPIITLADLKNAMSSEAHLCDRLVDTFNDQLQIVIDSPNDQAEVAKLAQIERAIGVSVRVLNRLNLEISYSNTSQLLVLR